MTITISGLSGSGKSSAAAAVSKRFSVPTVDIGKYFRKMAAKHGMSAGEFVAYAATHPEIDRTIDARVLRLARRGGIILQSHLSGALTAHARVSAFRIWLDASPRVRAGRVAGREGISIARALSDITRRDRMDRRRFLRLYGLDVNDLTVYDCVVQTDNLSLEGVVAVLLKEIAKVWPKNSTTTSKRRSRRTAPNRRPKSPRQPKK